MKYDIIISGCGAAGLSMLSHLINSNLRDSQILVIDNQNENDLNKTWCFWDNNPSCHYVPNHKWKKIRISNQQQILERSLEPLSYFEVRAKDFRASVIKLAKQHPNIHFVNDSVKKVTTTNHLTHVVGEKSNYYGINLINSIPSLSGSKITAPSLTQNFKGWRITTSLPVFNPEIATLMDFATSSSSEVKFFYILPFTENQALIEYTRLSSELAPAIDIHSLTLDCFPQVYF
jgi:lycopene beta-cyclase